MELAPVNELLLYPMDSSLGFFASKIPQFFILSGAAEFFPKTITAKPAINT
jgi:hypothetical protein